MKWDWALIEGNYPGPGNSFSSLWSSIRSFFRVRHPPWVLALLSMKKTRRCPLQKQVVWIWWFMQNQRRIPCSLLRKNLWNSLLFVLCQANPPRACERKIFCCANLSCFLSCLIGPLSNNYPSKEAWCWALGFGVVTRWLRRQMHAAKFL